MKRLIFPYTIKLVFTICFTTSFSLEAQEYATDRIFIKQFNKAKCIRSLEDKINLLKTKREMTLEHEVLLNGYIWTKLRAGLPLSPGERKRLLTLRNKGFSSKKLSSKKLWSQKSAEFKVLRKKCK